MRKFLALLLCLLLGSACAAEPAVTPEHENAAGRAERLGYALLAELHRSGENTVLSPVSLSIALSMAAEGARGATLSEILAVLDSDLSAFALPEGLSGANALFISPLAPLKQEYAAAIDKKYAAECFPLDASAVKKANAWIAEKTNGLIENFMQQPPADTGLILLNAVAMDLAWEKPFDQADTWTDDFFAPSGTIQLEMMHRTEAFRYVERDGVQILCLPYADSSLEMWIALPPEGGMADLIRVLADGGSRYLSDGAQMQEVELSLPRIDIADENQLIPPLQTLGVRAAFGPEADFSGISHVPLCIGAVRQKTRLQLTEEKTSAAAVTEVVMLAMALPPEFEPKPVIMNVNRPFAFAIVDGADAALCFCGVVENPAAQ